MVVYISTKFIHIALIGHILIVFYWRHTCMEYHTLILQITLILTQRMKSHVRIEAFIIHYTYFRSRYFVLFMAVARTLEL